MDQLVGNDMLDHELGCNILWEPGRSGVKPRFAISESPSHTRVWFIDARSIRHKYFWFSRDSESINWGKRSSLQLRHAGWNDVEKQVFVLCTSPGTMMLRSYECLSPRLTWRKLRNPFCKTWWSFRPTVLCQPMQYGQFMLLAMVLKTPSERKPFYVSATTRFMFFSIWDDFCNPPSYVVPSNRILYRTSPSTRATKQTTSLLWICFLVAIILHHHSV